jgi:hypothetical protein
VGRANRQAASQHVEDVRPCGADFRAVVLRQRQVDATVVEGVLTEWLQMPLAGPTAWLARVQRRLGRQDLRLAHIASALAQIACVPVLRVLRRQLEAGPRQSQEAYLFAEMLESRSPQGAQHAGAGVPSVDGGMRLADPTALVALVTPELPLPQVTTSLGWLSVSMTLF